MKATVHIAWSKCSWQSEPEPVFFGGDVSEILTDYTWLGQTVEIELPEPPTREQMNKTAINQEIGKHQNAITELQRRIMELQRIEHKPEAE